MRLSNESVKRLEAFLGAHLNDPELRLPHINLHGGKFARWVTTTLKIGAITIRTHIFMAPRLLVRGEDGRLTAPGWLVAHEATHVVQFQRAGFVPFLVKYLRDYFGTLWKLKKCDAAARMAAYLAIAEERAAREAEHAYQTWTWDGKPGGEPLEAVQGD